MIPIDLRIYFSDGLVKKHQLGKFLSPQNLPEKMAKMASSQVIANRALELLGHEKGQYEPGTPACPPV